MQFKQTLLRLFLLFFPFAASAQSTFLQQGDKGNILLDRLEIKQLMQPVISKKIYPIPYTMTNRPYSRDIVTEYANLLDSLYTSDTTSKVSLTKVDRYNLQRLQMNNIEWTRMPERFASKKPIWKRFYTTPPNLYEVHVPDFDLVINPVFQYTISKEKDNDQHLFQNTRGVVLRGRIANKIGFAAYLTDNQERPPSYVQDWTEEWQAVPGNGFYKSFKDPGGVDYFDARGYFTFGITKYIDVAFGYDKNFIGNGYRSLYLSEFSSNALFLKLNTRIWRFNYQNLFMELTPAEIPGGDQLLPKKYAAMHHLDISINRWLNIGLFEGVMFGRKDHFEFGYLNPIIFYRSIEQQNGSFDNSVIGIDAKANVAKKFQFYTQLMVDEFLLSEVKKNRGWWANKWGIQIGGKYVDAFGIKNLDLQAEHNRVRPFTYSHRDSVANYTHYNQPLAHPLGANFQEFIGIARYQPAPKWLAVAKLIWYQQGKDSLPVTDPNFSSFGGNIFLPNRPPYRTQDYGFDIGSGWKTNVLYASFLLSYELKENMFLELNAVYRKLDTKTAPIVSANTSIITVGLRWNMHRREFDF
jgi:hypothetical protein